MTVLRERNSTPGGHVVSINPGPDDVDPDKFARRRRLQNRALGIATPIILLAAWEIGGQTGFIDKRFFPPPSDIATTAVDMVRSGSLQGDFLVTMKAWLIAFVVGTLIGTAAGVLLGLSRIARAALEPVLSAFYTIPKLAILPLLLMIFGLGETPKIILVALGVFFITWISALEAVLDVPEGYFETARSFAVGRGRMLRKVLIPAVLPQIFVGLRIAVGQSILILIGVEFVTGDDGLGHMIWNSWQIFAADRMYVGIILVALIGFFLTNAIQLVGRWCVPWAPRSQRLRR